MTEPGASPAGAAPRIGRWRLMRRLVAFQIKLFCDGLRDLILSPLSIAVTAWGVVFGGHAPARGFDRLMRFGRRTDRWIDLFGAYRASGEREDVGLDGLLDAVERAVAEEIGRGGGAAEVRARLDALRRSRAPSGAPAATTPGDPAQ